MEKIGSQLVPIHNKAQTALLNWEHCMTGINENKIFVCLKNILFNLKKNLGRDSFITIQTIITQGTNCVHII